MKKTVLLLTTFLLFAVNAGTDEVFGDKLPQPAKVQIVNNLPEKDSIYFSSGPYIRISGISSEKNKIINESIEREKSATVLSGYNRLFCATDKLFFVLLLQAGQEYIVRVEVDKITMINMANGAMQTIQQKNYW